MSCFRSYMTLIPLFFVTCGPALAEESPWHFKGPFGVAVNSRDVVYVAEIDHARVSKFTADGEWLGTLRTIEGYGPLKGPFDVAIGPDDSLCICDTRNHKVLVLDRNEKLRFVLGKDERGAVPGSFTEPHFATVNRAGEIFVSDTFNARIQKFSPDGTLIKTWGRVGAGPGEFLFNGYVGGIACDNRGFLYVRETDGGRIQKYTEDGEYVLTASRRGIGAGELDEGYGLAVVGDTLYAVDTFQSRIQRFTLDGKFIDLWAPGEGNSGAHFNHPVDLAATRSGDLIASDWKNNRVLKLSPKGEFLKTWGEGESLKHLLAYEPPERRQRPPGHRVRFSVYAGASKGDVEACRKAHVDAIYWSIEGQAGDWGIGNAVQLAHQNNIEVHPSIAMFIFGQNGAFSRAHPEYHIWKKGADKPVQGILSWAHPEARTYRADHLVEQAGKTGVDGIMLDYIRYLGNDYCYDPVALKAYRERYGIDATTLAPDDPQWMQFRADYVTQFIVELRRKLADLDRHVAVSVYLSPGDPDKSALSRSMQDWVTWAKMGIVDQVQVAHYTRDLDLIYQGVRKVRAAVPDRVKVNCFLACYGGNLNTPELLKKGIDVAVAAGADEVTIYRGDSIWELDLWDAIRQAAESINRDAPPTSRPAQPEVADQNTAAANLVRNGSFEERDPADATLPRYWTEKHYASAPLSFTGEHHDGAVGALLIGDGKAHLWRQSVTNVPVRAFTLSAFVKADNVNFSERDDHAYLYGHILYEGQSYEQATHFFIPIKPGTYDWTRVSVAAAAPGNTPIQMIQISVVGKFASGKAVIDQVKLTANDEFSPEGSLKKKIDDLQQQLTRVGEVDASVAQARKLLADATAALAKKPSDLNTASSHWVEACRAVSRNAWAKMFPDVMSDRKIEAKMLYHAGQQQQAAYIDNEFSLVKSMKCNGVYWSLGSWMSVTYKSDLLPAEPGWVQPNFDPIAYAIDHAHKNGIKAWGYLAACYGTSSPPTGPESLYTRYPEWFARGPDPAMPTFPDPANPGYRDYLVKIYIELATRYKLDGIGLDYIRYPSDTALNYDAINRKAILEKTGIDILAPGAGDVSRDPAKWEKIKQYRADVVGSLVKRIHDEVKAARPDVTIMACLISEIDLCKMYGQDWTRSSKWIDYASPMNYDDRSIDLQMLEDQKRIFHANGARYIPAVGGMPELHQQRTISEWARHVALQRKIGGDGMIIYRMNGLDQGVAAFFGNGPFSNEATFPPPRKD